MKKIVECIHIYKNYNQGEIEVPALKDVTFTVEEGDFTSIIGPSGSGKSTLMNLIGCLDKATSGSLLIDGNPVHVHPKEQTLVKGDARVACIAAASIFAKVTRDAMMVAYAEDYPDYHLDSCKGYGSAEHIAAVREHGCSPIHRVSFCGNFLETPRLF